MNNHLSFDDLERAVAKKDMAAIARIMFSGKDVPAVRAGFKSEGELWDYKRDVPQPQKESENAWACIAADLLAFYNNKGGVVIFGMSDDFRFVGASQRYDSKLFNDRIRSYTGDIFFVDFYREFIQHDQRYLGLAVVGQRGPLIGRFQTGAPKINGKTAFVKDGSAVRVGDSTRILSKKEADEYARRNKMPTLFDIYAVNEERYRILAPDYAQFVQRDGPCNAMLEALVKPRVAVASVLGIGGVGKTALATWGALQAYDSGTFDFIISITAKDRELTTNMGIAPLSPELADFDSLLDAIADVMGFPEEKQKPIFEKETAIRNLLNGEKALLVVDNLETVADERIISFLDDLPDGVRAIVTSRKPRVRQSIKPIDVGPLTLNEVQIFIGSLTQARVFKHAGNLSAAQHEEIFEATDGIPLAIRWIIGRSHNADQLMRYAGALKTSGNQAEELLEFSFRRLFDEMNSIEKEVLLLLSQFQKPLRKEAIIVGCASDPRCSDAIDELKENSLIQQFFDPDANDFTYGVIPITRKFGMSELDRKPDLQEQFRKRMSDYYQAKDVRDENERVLVRELRSGMQGSELALLDLAIAAQRRGDLDTAERLYDDAVSRSPRSWRALKAAAEFQRDFRSNSVRAISLYTQCLSYAPKQGRDRGIILREYAILMRNSGAPDALRTAIECCEKAVNEMPSDGVAIYMLATLYEDRGWHLRTAELLKPHAFHKNDLTRQKIRPVLLRALKSTGDHLSALELQKKFATEDDPPVLPDLS